MVEAYRVTIAPEASADLQMIHAFIARESPNSAARMVERILATIESLGSFPHRTVAEHVTPRTKHPVRSLPVRPYIVYFRVLNEDRMVRVLTIRHGARRRPRRL